MTVDRRDRAEGASEHARTRRLSWFWADKIGRGECLSRRCGAPVRFLQNCESGKWMPFDGPDIPVALRTEIRQDDRGDWRQAMQVDLADSHFASCLDAGRFRNTPRLR